jgi:hypothetical protein
MKPFTFLACLEFTLKFLKYHNFRFRSW